MDVRQQSDNANDKINAILSFPSMLLNNQYRDTVESIGKVFEPQLNLGIEF
jgi:hypothetical protein